jgi:hypothetical protein
LRRLQHLAGDLEADGRRLARRRRIAAQPLQQVGAVHARRAHLHQQVAVLQHRLRDLLDNELLFTDHDRAHGPRTIYLPV